MKIDCSITQRNYGKNYKVRNVRLLNRILKLDYFYRSIYKLMTFV
jgi:hypothetical protein